MLKIRSYTKYTLNYLFVLLVYNIEGIKDNANLLLIKFIT